MLYIIVTAATSRASACARISCTARSRRFPARKRSRRMRRAALFPCNLAQERGHCGMEVRHLVEEALNNLINNFYVNNDVMV